MSFEPHFIPYPSTESTDVLRPELFFAPPPQHTDAPSPELFDRELDLDLPFGEFGDFFSTVISSPPASAYSADSVREVSSYYSSDFTQSDYPIPSGVDGYYSLDNGIYGTHDSIHSTDFSNGPPSNPLHPAEAQFDFETSDLSPNFVGISPEDLSTRTQAPPTGDVPTPLPTPDSDAQMAPAPDRPYQCPLCPHSAKRKHNLKTHIATHSKSKPFECTTCGGRFSRKNDLNRHRNNPQIHQKQMPESSISRRRFDPNEIRG